MIGFWIVLMGFLVAFACALIGNYLVLRRMALVGDAISHSVLPGIAVAFLFTESLHSLPVFIGAIAAGVLTTVLIEFIHSRSRIKEDSAIGITFSTLFAIGVILVSTMTNGVDLDTDCVLYGSIESIPLVKTEIAGLVLPAAIPMMAGVAAGVLLLTFIFYKELLVSSFDEGLSASLGIRPALVHYCLMSALSVVVVSSFQAVGAILVIAMLILPASTAFLLTSRLPVMLVLSTIHALISAAGGYRLAVYLDSAAAGSMVVVGAGLFCLAWIFHRPSGLLWLALRKFRRGSGDLSEYSHADGAISGEGLSAEP